MESASKHFLSSLACLSLFISAVFLLHAGALQMPSTFSANSSLRSLSALCVSALSFSPASSIKSPNAPAASNQSHSYLGFDRNVYPGDEALSILRKTFTFTSYWLSSPPGEKINTWLGKRELLRKHGFGFVVLFRGREEKDLKSVEDASTKGQEDAQLTVQAGQREGFGPQTIIYLDIEEGGRLVDAYHAYLGAWSEELTHAGFRAGAYCSGIPVNEGQGVSINTADDIRNHGYGEEMIFWVYNDACPPSPGCAFPQTPPPPAASGISYAAIWQFAQSPRRKEFTARCAATYHRDGNCYAPGDTARAWFLDLNSATSPDPSGGARQN